jgi:hypothetical protein
MLARIATSRGIQLGFQVMLTMVSIDGELNEELSRSLSLAKEFFSQADLRNMDVGLLVADPPAHPAKLEFSTLTLT